MRRKILMGVLALALPIGTMAALSPVASAHKAPPNPVSCHVSATVSISPALSVKGVLSSKGKTGTTTVHVTYSSCTTATGPASVAPKTLTILSAAAKDKAWKTDGNSKKGYYLGVCSAFASKTTAKSLGKAVKNMLVAGGTLKGAKAAEGTVGAEVGFNIIGTVKGGTYPTASHGASIAAGLLNDANNTNLISGCPSGPVTTIDIDPANSTAVL